MVEGQGIGEASAALAVPKSAPSNSVSSATVPAPESGQSFSEQPAVAPAPKLDVAPSSASDVQPASAAEAAQSVASALESSAEQTSGLDVSSNGIDAPSTQQAIAAAEQAVNAALQETLGVNEQVRIGVDKNAEAFVYQTVDKESGEVKNQFPSEEALRRLAFWRSRETGIPPSTSGVVVDGKV